MERVDFRDQIVRNKYKTLFLIFSIFVVFLILGYVISLAFDPGYFFVIMIIAIIFSLSYILVSYYNSDKIAIASVKATRAKRTEHREYYSLVEGLTIASGLPMPKLYIMSGNQINAFASGRDPKHAVICVTEGALHKLDKRELEGVLAHELSHIGNYDIRYLTIVTVMVGMISIISEIFLRSLFFRRSDNDKAGLIFIVLGIALAILAPIIVYFVQLAVSRKREYAADATAVQFTRNPRGLIGALEKIKSDHAPLQKKQVSKALAPLFISNPFRKWGSTHPPLEKRIALLQRM